MATEDRDLSSPVNLDPVQNSKYIVCTHTLAVIVLY